MFRHGPLENQTTPKAWSVLGSWVGARRLLYHFLFLTASRVVLPKILVLTRLGRFYPWSWHCVGCPVPFFSQTAGPKIVKDLKIVNPAFCTACRGTQCGFQGFQSTAPP